MRPPLTFLLPIRNGIPWIGKHLPRVLENLGEEDELLIIDDGSNDNTPSLLRHYTKLNPKVRLVCTPPRGLVHALNLGISESENEWIARFDIDDFYTSDRIENQIKLADEKTSVIFADYQISASLRFNVGVIASPINSLATTLSLLKSRRTAHPTAIFRKSLAVEVGSYREEEFPSEDLGLWFRLSKIAKLKSLPKVVVNYNLHKTSITAKNRKLALSKKQEVIERYFSSDYAKRALEEIESTFSLYDECSLSLERKILHLGDLSDEMASKYIRSNTLRTLWRKTQKEEGKLKFAIALSRLSFERALRQTYRIL